MLRAQVERLTKENAELRVKLTAAITPLRPTPVTQPTAATKPATALAPKGAGKKVMYLLDGSGSMVNVFDAARMEVRKAIDDLAAGDAFNVIFDSDNFSSAFPALLPATDRNKKQCYDFLDKAFVRGENDPIAAMEKAFAQKPNFIWWLTDGSLNDTPRKIAETIDRRNTNRIRINTITLLAAEDHADERWLLWKVAHDSGGKCIDKNG